MHGVLGWLSIIAAVTMCTTRFKFKKFYIPLRKCAFYGSQNKQQLFPYTTVCFL
jgi:hypothetical protein